MDRELILKIKADNASWKAAIAESKRAAKSLFDEVENSAARNTRSAQRHAADVVRIAKKSADDRKKEEEKLAAAAEKAADRSQRAAEKAALAKRLETAKGAAAQLAAIDKVLTKEEAAEAAKVNLIRRTNAAHVAAAEKQILASGRLISHQGRLIDVSKAAGNAGADGMGRIAAAAGVAAAAMSILRMAVGGVQQAIRDAAEASKALAAGAVSQRDKQRELAATLGVKNDNAFLAQNAQFGVDTAMRPDEVLGFRMQLSGSGIQFRGKNISEKEYAKYEKSAGALGIARGVDASTVGDLAGGVLGLKDYTGYGEKASEEATGTMNRQLAILAEGRGELGVLAYQQAKVNAALVNEDALRGSVQSPEEAATLVSVAAEKSPRDAAETVRATLRGLQDYGDKDAGPLLSAAGIRSGQSPIEKLRLLAPVVEAKARASGQNVNEVLRGAFHDELTSEGIGVMLNRGIGGGLFDKRADIATRLAGTGPAAATVGEFMGSEAGQARVADAGVSRAEMLRGAENSRIDTLRKQALDRLIRDKAIDTTGTNIGDFVAGKIPFGQIEEGRQERISLEAKRLLNERAAEAGATGFQTPLDQATGGRGRLFGLLGIPNSDMTSEARNEELNAVMNRIEAKGGRPLSMSRTEQLLEEQNALMRRFLGGAGVPPAVVRPGPAPAGRRP